MHVCLVFSNEEEIHSVQRLLGSHTSVEVLCDETPR